LKTVYYFLGISLGACLVSCEDSEVTEKKLITGTVVEITSGQPVEDVIITGFDGGVYTNNNGTQYGTAVQLGTTNACGEFQIELPENIRGVGAHGQYDTTVAVVRFVRTDVGETITSISYAAETADVSIEYAPLLKPFFKSLYVVRSADLQSVTIGWNVHSLREIYTCPPPSGGPCINDSDGFLHVQRSDISGGFRFNEPIEIDTDQSIVDSDLPEGNFTYWLTPGDSHITGYWADVTNSTDTLFLVKPYSSPVYNHCD
jgi:hypothetical protein